jgi:hypothetical protein
MLVVEEPLKRLAQIKQQMKPIRNVDRGGRATPCAIRIVEGAITANHFDARVVSQPGSKGRSRAIGQQVNRHARFEIDEYGAIGSSLPEGKIINTEHAGRGADGWWDPADKA